jgi:hypothetical protein
MLLAATTRPELLDARPGWGGARRAASTLELEPLSRDDSERMVRELLGGELQVLERDLIIERADGNPFFVEELLATLIDRGVVKLVDGTWQVGALLTPSPFRTRSNRPRGEDGSPGSGRKGCSASGRPLSGGCSGQDPCTSSLRCRARLSCARRA